MEKCGQPHLWRQLRWTLLGRPKAMLYINWTNCVAHKNWSPLQVVSKLVISLVSHFYVMLGNLTHFAQRMWETFFKTDQHSGQRKLILRKFRYLYITYKWQPKNISNKCKPETFWQYNSFSTSNIFVLVNSMHMSAIQLLSSLLCFGSDFEGQIWQKNITIWPTKWWIL